jgi:CheY-like chemotaxis protein
MHNLLFVSEVKSHSLMSVKEHLEMMNYRIISVSADMDAIHEVKEPTRGILLYVEEKLLDRRQTLYYIKDWVSSNSIPIFAMGFPEDLEELKTVVSAHLVRREFIRPLKAHVSDMANKIDSFIKKNSMQKKILAVDDSGTMLRTVKGWLENKYSVFLANSGAMAIKYLALNKPDLILLDYEMPVADGKQVLEMIRSEKEFMDIPVIFLTKKGDKESIMNVKDLKPEGYLLKSLEPAQIIRAVDEFFEKMKALM